MLKRFSISLEEDLLADFDQVIKDKKYKNRSEAIRDLIRNSFVDNEWADDKDVMGVITLVYDHHQANLQENITTLQHDFFHYIVSTTHVHMDHHNCMEVIIVKGKARDVMTLSNDLNSLRGVRNCRLAMSSTGKHLH
jgi:CopG family nickel-responsive transcriptional regulator